MRPTLFAFSFFAVAILMQLSNAAQFNLGDIVSPQFDNAGTVLVIRANTGNREVLSLYPDVGQGPAEFRPTSIAQLPDGDFLVTEAFFDQALYRINAITGDRTLVSGIAATSRGTGPIDHPQTVLYRSTGDVILTNSAHLNFNTGFVTRVDLTTGDRTLISGLGTGSGTDFNYPAGGAIDASGKLIVADNVLPAVFSVDLTTGARTVISGLGHGTGPALPNIQDLVILPNGQIITEGNHQLIRIDPVSGSRTVLATPSNDYERIALGSNGALLASTLGRILSVDPTSGIETIVSANGVNSGPNMFWGDMVVVPEPSWIAPPRSPSPASRPSRGAVVV